MEVAGIEPASAGFSVGLLRAQSTGDCRGRRCCRRRRRPVSDLVVPRAPSARARGKPYFMMPVIWSVGLGPGGHRCPRQRARAEARRLFVCSGSLTWLRRPRLASPTSTTNVETIHPRVVRFCTAPPCYRSAFEGHVAPDPACSDVTHPGRSLGDPIFSRRARRRAGRGPCRARHRAWRGPGAGRRASCPWPRRARLSPCHPRSRRGVGPA